MNDHKKSAVTEMYPNIRALLATSELSASSPSSTFLNFHHGERSRQALLVTPSSMDMGDIEMEDDPSLAGSMSQEIMSTSKKTV